MNNFVSKFFLLAIAVLWLTSAAPTPTERTVSDFKLLNVDGKTIGLSQYPKAKGFIVVFTCNHCPFAKLYPSRLNELHDKYSKLDVPVLAISSTDTLMYVEDTYHNMQKTAKAHHYNFPYLFDGTQEVAKNFKAERTPHAFVIWKQGGEWVIKYNGAIDDNGAEPKQVKEHYVADAVDVLLQGKPLANAENKSIGCNIHYRK